MIFCDIKLATRIERAECRLLAECAAALRRNRPDADILTIPLAGGFAVYTGADSPGTKLAGLGFAGSIDEAALTRVEAQWADRDTPLQVELATLADPAVATLLTTRGYVLRGYENILGRCLSEPIQPASRDESHITIRPAVEAEYETWIDVVVTGFGVPDTQGVPSHESFSRQTLERVFRDMTSIVSMKRILAWIDGRPVGGASFITHEGVAQLCGAATLPEFRRRGVQGALLHARLDAARRAGCDVATLSTLPGSRSQENAQKRGFSLLYARAILVRIP